MSSFFEFLFWIGIIKNEYWSKMKNLLKMKYKLCQANFKFQYQKLTFSDRDNDQYENIWKIF